MNIGNPLTAVDPEGDPLTYAATGTDAEFFDIIASTGQLVTKAALDYETKNSYLVTVGVRDNKDPEGEPDRRQDDAIRVTILVTNQDEPGAITLSGTQPRIGNPFSAALVDPDGGVTDPGWQWERSTDITNWAPITDATTAIYTPTSDDQGRYLRVVATYTDVHGPDKTATAKPDLPVAVGYTTRFSDVPTEGVHTPAIRALSEQGVFTDTQCGQAAFCPHQLIQRWVMAVWMIRLLGNEPPAEGTSRFDDIADGQWWIRYAEQLADRGITIGCTADPPRYCPDRSVT